MKKEMTDYPASLTAGATSTFNVQGNSFHVVTATSPIHISFDDSKEIQRHQGMGGTSTEPYYKVTVRSEVAQNITIALGSGSIFDSRANISATLNTTIAPANINEALGSITVNAGSAIKLVSANADRKELRIGIKSDNDEGLYFGDINIGVTKQGGFIEVGGVEYVTSEGAIYAYNPSASDVTVNLLDMRRV